MLECHNCPRSYHRRCLDPPIHGNFKIDGAWYCPNCEILKDDLSRAANGAGNVNGIGLVNGVIPSHKTRQGVVKFEIDGVTPLHRETAKGVR